jgi:iron complex outermembrane recepter protein
MKVILVSQVSVAVLVLWLGIGLGKAQSVSSEAEAAKKAQTKLKQSVLEPHLLELPEVLVKAETERSLSVLGPVEARQVLNQTPGGVSLLLADEYKQGRTSTLKDALQFAPGVLVQPRFGSDEARISIRGSGIQRTFHGRGLLILQDGVPINLADGSFDMQAIEPLAAQYVEVQRGANALRYGSSTLGGSIHYVSPTGYEADKLLLRAEAGSFGYLRGQVSSGLVEGPFDYYASLTHSSQDGFRNHAEQNTQRFLAQLGAKLKSDLETRFYFGFINTESELPGSLTLAQLNNDPTQTTFAQVNRDQKRDFKLYRIANKSSYVWDEQTLDGTFSWSNKDLFHPIFQIVDQASNDFSVGLSYTNEKDLAGRKNQFTLGTRQILGITEADQFGYAATTGQARGPQTLDSTQTATSSTLFAENRHYVIEPLALVLGLQLDWSTRQNEVLFARTGAQNFVNTTLLNPSTRSVDESYAAFNPKMGLLYELDPETTLFTNFSRSYEPPSFSEMFDTRAGQNLASTVAQEAWTIEVGSRGKSGIVDWDSSFYHSWVRNELLSLSDPNGPASTINAENTLHTGVELGVGVQIARGLVDEADQLYLRQNYTWSRFVFDHDQRFGNNQLAGLPEHFYLSDLIYTHPSGFYLGPQVEATLTDSPVDHANTLDVDSYFLMSFKIGYKSVHGFHLFFEARNLADEKYAATTGVVDDLTIPGRSAAQFNPGDGRAFYGGIEYRW